MTKIKVVHLVESMKVGGLERVIALIADHLNKDKYHFELWCIYEGGEIADELNKKGVSVKVLNIPNYYNPINIFKLANLIKKEKPAIVHTHTYFSNTITRLALKLAKGPIVFTHIHNIYSDYTARNLWIERWLSPISDKIIPCSDAVKRFVLNKERIPPERVLTIHNGVPLERFEENVDVGAIRNSLALKEHDRVLILVAALRPKKGHQYLIEAMGNIAKNFKDVKCLIVGGGPLRKELEKQVESLNLEKAVIFCGTRDDVPHLLKAADIFVLPSLTEGLPLVTAEAMAAGLPVVATDVGGTGEVVQDGVTGLLVPSKDVKALTEAVEVLLNDPLKMKQLGQAGYQLSHKDFAAEVMVQKIEQLYAEFLEMRGDL